VLADDRGALLTPVIPFTCRVKGLSSLVRLLRSSPGLGFAGRSSSSLLGLPGLHSLLDSGLSWARFSRRLALPRLERSRSRSLPHESVGRSGPPHGHWQSYRRSTV